MLLLTLLSCGPKEEATTTTETAEEVSTTTQKKTTTSKHIEMGVEPQDEGWSFWDQF